MSSVLLLYHGTLVSDEPHFTYHYLIKAAELQCLEPVEQETNRMINQNRWVGRCVGGSTNANKFSALYL